MRNEKIHDSHYGMEKCRAKESLFWPNKSKDVEVNVASCGFRVKIIIALLLCAVLYGTVYMLSKQTAHFFPYSWVG